MSTRLLILKYVIRCDKDELKYFAAKEIHKKLSSGIHGKIMTPWRGLKCEEDTECGIL